jgi:hypothetical protein
MIRNLKVLLAAAMALTALGAVGASGAQAAEFHCSVSPCTGTTLPDGTAKNSHHVFIVTQGAVSAATTCNSLTGNSTITGNTTKEITLTSLVYAGCNVAGEPSTVETGKCDYLFTSDGTVHVKGCEGGAIKIVVTATGCTFTIGEQTLGGITYTTIGTSPKREVTVSTNVTGIVGTANDSCTNLKINPGEITGDYTTGNTIVRGDAAGGAQADAWYL